jgi:hypothetical protein
MKARVPVRSIVSKWVALWVGLKERSGSSMCHRGMTGVILLFSHRWNSIHGVGGKVFATKVIPKLSVLILLNWSSRQYLNLSGKHHLESLTTDGLLDTREPGTITPFIQLATKSIGLELEKAQLAGGECTVTTRGMNVSN